MIDLDSLLTLSFGGVAGLAAGGLIAYHHFKRLLNAATDLLIAIRDAAVDDRITEEEFQQIIAAGGAVIAELRGIRKPNH
jgi:hypothetical protein